MRSAARWAAPILVALAVAACSGGAGGDDGEAHWIVSLLQRIPGIEETAAVIEGVWREIEDAEEAGGSVRRDDFSRDLHFYQAF